MYRHNVLRIADWQLYRHCQPDKLYQYAVNVALTQTGEVVVPKAWPTARLPGSALI